MKRVLWGLLLATLLEGCTARHIAPYTPKQREYQPPPPRTDASHEVAVGSLWRPGGPNANLFVDPRAFQENDLLVIRVEEVANARRSADTQLDRESQVAADIEAFLDKVGTLTTAGAAELKAGLSSQFGRRFAAEGSTARTERLTATVPAIVRRVLPNGNLFVEGHRVVLVNDEEQHFYISGVVRPIDVDQENSIKSSLVADAEIEFTGRGVLTETQQQGFLARYLGWLWPF